MVYIFFPCAFVLNRKQTPGKRFTIESIGSRGGGVQVCKSVVRDVTPSERNVNPRGIYGFYASSL